MESQNSAPMYKFDLEEIKNASRSTMRMPRHDEKFLVSLNGSPVAQYHEGIYVIWIRRAVSDEVYEKNEYESFDMSNLPKNMLTFKREVLKALRINEIYGADWRLRKITYDGQFKIEHDRDVWNLNHNDRVEIVNQPKRGNIVTTLEDTDTVENVEEIRKKRLERMGENH